jgi:hypothetical protein
MQQEHKLIALALGAEPIDAAPAWALARFTAIQHAL